MIDRRVLRASLERGRRGFAEALARERGAGLGLRFVKTVLERHISTGDAYQKACAKRCVKPGAHWKPPQSVTKG